MYIIFIGQTPDDARSTPSVFASRIEGIVGMFAMSVGDFEDFFGDFSALKEPFHSISKVVFCVYMVMVPLLLINMLIAMMGNTYQLVNNTQKEYFRQWAKVVLIIEQSVTTEERKEQMHKYSSPLPDGSRALAIRWFQTEKEKEEIRLLREKSRQKHKMSLQKKKNKQKPVKGIINVNEAEQGHVNV